MPSSATSLLIDPTHSPPEPTFRLECCKCGSHVLVSAVLRVGAGGQCPTCYSYELQPVK
jgi:hypothetical protein